MPRYNATTKDFARRLVLCNRYAQVLLLSDFDIQDHFQQSLAKTP